MCRNHNHQRRRNQGDPRPGDCALPPTAAPSPAPAHGPAAPQLGGLPRGPHHPRHQRLGANQRHELLHEAGVPDRASCRLPQWGELSKDYRVTHQDRDYILMTSDLLCSRQVTLYSFIPKTNNIPYNITLGVAYRQVLYFELLHVGLDPADLHPHLPARVSHRNLVAVTRIMSK